MTKVLITGGTGMLGSRLSTMLAEIGHEVVFFSRKADPGGAIPVYEWDPENKTADPRALEGVEAIIHLAGAPMARQKWTEQRRQEIIDSRVKTADFLRELCEKLRLRPHNYISASAIGWYPVEAMHPLDENSAPGKGFLAEVCTQWEESADRFAGVADHVCKLRIGLVLSKAGGALPQLVLPVKYYLAAGLGSGKQAVSWIHIDDVCRMFIHALENDLEGAYNAVGPESTSNQDFMRTLADVLEKPVLLPNAPEFLLKWLLGSRADLLLKGAPVSSKKIRDTGFWFEYPTLHTALSGIYGA